VSTLKPNCAESSVQTQPTKQTTLTAVMLMAHI